MRLKAIAPWFGSKREMAPTIITALGPHRSYWEPFCGSMAVLLAKPKRRLETVNDLHGDLINLARVVRDPVAGKALERHTRLVFCGDDEVAAANKLIRSAPCGDALSVKRAAAFMIASWQSRNGEAGLRESKTTRKLCVRWGNSGGSPGTRWFSAVRSIAHWRKRLETTTILRRDGFEVIENIADEAECVIYVDPPYIVKSGTYEHDFAEADHERLRGLLGRFKKSRVVVSYYDHPTVRKLYDGWHFQNCSKNKSLGNTSPLKQKGKTTIAPEVLIINRPTHSSTGLFDA